ncbi:MAG: SPOR domain-containing protein [Bacteroidota bacterium]|nr:SPOR domain-containing protein [Kiloniellaceae bacterium]
MTSDPGRGREREDEGLSAEPPAFSDPSFSEEGMRRIIYGGDREAPRDARSQVFAEDTAELEANLRRRRNLVPIVTALAAVVCFGAIVWYAYNWGTGQVASDDLPVVSAEPMPEKVKPEQPGGMEVPHQGIAVLNPDGETPQAVERLLPRPEVPAPPEPLPGPPAEIAGAAPDERTIEPLPEVPAIADGGAADVTEAPAVDEPAAEEDVAEDVAEDAVPRPQSKPDDQIANLLEQQAVETANGGTTPPAPPAAPQQTAPQQTAAVAKGAIVVQLSSVKSEAAANQEWKRLQASHPAVLGKLGLALETAAVQGTTYYRVQTGPFASRAAAADVCTQLKARNQDCLVKQR